jgi:hypothetical protein
VLASVPVPVAATTAPPQDAGGPPERTNGPDQTAVASSKIEIGRAATTGDGNGEAGDGARPAGLRERPVEAPLPDAKPGFAVPPSAASAAMGATTKAEQAGAANPLAMSAEPIPAVASTLPTVGERPRPTTPAEARAPMVSDRETAARPRGAAAGSAPSHAVHQSSGHSPDASGPAAAPALTSHGDMGVTTIAPGSAASVTIGPNERGHVSVAATPDRHTAPLVVGGDVAAATVDPAPILATTPVAGKDEMAVRLSLSRLGVVELRVSKDNAANTVTIAVDRPETLRTMIADQDQLRSVLDQNGFDRQGKPIEFVLLGTSGPVDGRPMDAASSNQDGRSQHRRDDQPVPAPDEASHAEATKPGLSDVRLRPASQRSVINITA